RNRRGGPTSSSRRATNRSGRWSTRSCDMRAAFAWTTSSGCSGCGGSPRAPRPPRAPMCGTTTRRGSASSRWRGTAPTRARAATVGAGEDVGTVEPWVRDYRARRGLLGTSILWFELDRDGDGGPLHAQRWREYCLSSVTTHDLPPTAGYLAGEHVRLRAELG